MSERWHPAKYQLTAVRWLVQHGSAGLFLDPGLGKTSITYAAIKTLIATKEARRPFLVIAPLRPCHLVWPAEARKWTEFAGLRVEVLHGRDKNDAVLRPADVQVINPAGLEWLFETALPKLLKRSHGEWPWHGLIPDESTQFKRTNTLRFKLLRPWLPKFHRRWILTGTPAPNGLLDLFGQMYIVDLGASLGAYITHYRRRYFAPTGYGGYTWVPQEGAKEKIQQKIAPYVLRMSDDVLELPPISGVLGVDRVRPNLTEVVLPPAAQRTYDTIENAFFAELAAGSVTAVNAGVKSQKLCQAANGGVYLDKGGDEDADDVGTRREKRRWALIHDAKTEAVAEILDELSGKPALVVFDYHHDLARLRAHRDLRSIPAMGEGSIEDDRRLEAAWNAGDLPHLLVNAQSAAHGLNLQEAGQAIVWHSLTWNWEHYWQLIKRLWRQGQRRRVHIHHVVARGTVDEAKVAVLQAKGGTERALLRALQNYAAKKRV